jgi:hypothetical protein
MKLPREYLSCLDGGRICHGRLRSRPGRFRLWTPKEIAADIEDGLSSRVRGFVGFGDSGDGEMLAFDESGGVYLLPLVGMHALDAKKIAASWSEFLTLIRR